MVSNASDDLPDPDKPVKTISLSRGNSRVRFLRLCSRAPRMRIVSVDTETPPVDSACLVNDASVVQVGGERMFDQLEAPASSAIARATPKSPMLRTTTRPNHRADPENTASKVARPIAPAVQIAI